MLLKFILVLVLVGTCQGAYKDCDYYQKMIPNRKYSISSPEYPDKYPPGKSCRWYMASPRRTRISLICEKFNIPRSRKCQMDRFGVSRRGNIFLRDTEYFCGEGKLEVLSKKNRMNMVLLTVAYSTGGSFSCHAEAKEVTPTTRPPPAPICNCGYTNDVRIVGGTETGVNYYPMLAALMDAVEKELFCGATIISSSFILTAAHCLSGKTPWKVQVLVGDHDISVGNDTDSARLYSAERFYIHQDYNKINHKNDIALVKVRNDIQFSREVGPVCLPFSNATDSFAGETVYALGWGATEYDGETSDKLLYAPLDVITLKQCKPTYGDLVTEKQICTYKKDKDACQSDSGGPLLWKDPASKLVKIVGIISYGIRCATENPSVNTRITPYLDWIMETTPAFSQRHN